MATRVELDIQAPRGLHFVADDGTIGLVTNMFDIDGDETRDPDTAAALVVYLGPDKAMPWLSVEVGPGSFRGQAPQGSA